MFSQQVRRASAAGLATLSLAVAGVMTAPAAAAAEPPVVWMVSPAHRSYVSGDITIEVDLYTDLSIESVRYEALQGGLNTTVTEAPFSLSVDTTTLPNGSWNVHAQATDSSGQINQNASFLHLIVHNPQDTTELCADAQPSGFADVDPMSAHASNIDCAVALGLALGRTETTFEPAGNVSRAQMATFVARLLDGFGVLPPAEPGQDMFSDDDGTSHEENINRLAQAGIANGTGSGQFNPSGYVTRLQMAALLGRSIEYAIGGELPGPERFFADYYVYDPYIDNDDYVNQIAELGIAMGSGADRMFYPSSNVSRAQMTSFLVRTVAALLAPAA